MNNPSTIPETPVEVAIPTVLRLGLLLQNPSPHQVDLLNALADRPDVDVFVGYAYPRNPKRSWGTPVSRLPWEVMPARTHDLSGRRVRQWLDSKTRHVWIVAANYSSLRTHVAIRHLHRQGACWGYLGEPPRATSLYKRWVRHCLLGSILMRAHGVAGTGEEARRRYEALLPFDKPTASIPYYQHLDDLRAMPLPTPPAEGEPLRFLNVSQLVHRKGLDVLLEACSRLSRDDWTLDIYGRGELEDELWREIQWRQLPVRLRGVVPYDRRANMFAGYHCFAFSSRHDGWGMAVPEALAAGLPVISTDRVMSAHDFIRDGQNGFMVPAEDPNALANAMGHYLSNSRAIVNDAKNARLSVSNYLPEAGVERLVAFANGLLRRSMHA